jgi:N-methylhydantoinase A
MNTKTSMRLRLGVDVGGTFTDLLLIDESDGSTYRAKVPSTPGNQAEGVLSGIAKVCAIAGVSPDRIGDVMHGTTVATNAVLEGKGARVGLIVTDGFRQVLHIARSYVPGGLAGWIVWQPKPPLAALVDTFEVKERVAADGAVVRGLDEESVRVALRRLASSGVQSVTVSLINSFANDAHERRIAEIAAQEMPGIPISLSCDILPEMREYERTATTVANAYVRPVVERYLDSLEQECAARGIAAKLRVLRSDGGLMGFDVAKQAPVNLLMSGPAGGVAGAVWAGGRAGLVNLLTFDMGGTSTDVALVENGEPRLRRETVVGDVTVRSSSLDVRTVGAGGGSIARVPALTGALRVGPQSAGALPGPAAYGRGGTLATVTDANVVLGYLPVSLLGGEMSLDRQGAAAAVQVVADALGVSLIEAAQGIYDIVNENMFGALRLVSVEQGYDPRGFALMGFGGAGPLHANALGTLLGSWPVVIPPSPGVLCAYGDATTRLRSEAARTFVRRFDATSTAELLGLLQALADQAAQKLAGDGLAADDQTVTCQIDVRYHGQGLELPINIDLAALEAGGIESLAATFDAAHERLFTFALDAEREIVNIRAVVQGGSPNVVTSDLAPGGSDSVAAAIQTTRIFVSGGEFDAVIYDRTRLAAGNHVVGPAVVVEMDSTTLVLPEHTGVIHASGNILIWPNLQLTKQA